MEQAARRDDVEQSIPGRFEQVAAARPDATAVSAPDRSLTYAELDRAADGLASTLGTRLGDAEEAVVLLLDQGADAVIAILGILKAGKFYVPLDPSHPPSRLREMLSDAGSRLVVTSAAHASLAVQLAGDERNVLRIEEVSASPSVDRPRIALTPDRLAYLFYTSGSTGQPKGVIDNHRNVLHNVMRYTKHLCIGPQDRLSLIQSPGFSGTVSSLFAALLNGGTICPYQLRERGFAPLAAWVSEQRITIYHSVPLIFRAMVGPAARFPTVRVVRLEGDQALPADVDLHRAHFEPEAILAIGLGATETGLSCQYRIDRHTTIGAGTLPVGYPTRDMSIVILDEAGADCGRGRTGEIGVRSRYLAVGYWRQPERTRAAFMPDPDVPGARIYRTGDLGRLRADGCLEFLGRKDFRPRIRGQHVDAAEVEAALTRIEGVREAAVSSREDERGDARLVAFLVVADGATTTVGQVRRALAPVLPDAMIPTEVVLLDRLPLDGNGKLDRRALRVPSTPTHSCPAETAAIDATERTLLAIWSHLFGRDDLSVDDDFLELGGDSLRAAQIVLAIERTLGTRLPPHILYAAPTVARLAACVRGDHGAALVASGASFGLPGGDAADGMVVPMQPRGSRPPLFFVHDHDGGLFCYADLVRRLGPDQPCHGLRSPFEQSPGAAPVTLELLATRYCAAIRRVQSAGPYQLCGTCFGGVLAFEIARQLTARGDEVALLAILAVTPFDFPTLLAPRAAHLFALHASRTRVVPRVRYYARRLDGLGWGETLRYLRGRSKLVLPLLRRHWHSRSRARSASAPPPERTALGVLHDALFRRYAPQPFAGRAALFLSAQSVEQYTSDPVRDWRPLAAAGVDVRVMEVSGGAMLDEPHVGALVVRLRELLAAGHEGCRTA